MELGTIVWFLLIAILLFLIFLPNIKKWMKNRKEVSEEKEIKEEVELPINLRREMLFITDYDGDSWINNYIQDLAGDEDLCENCSNCIHCGIRQTAENIKQKYDRKFILTRCKIFQANDSLKMREKPEQQKHFDVIVWVNPFTERIREKQCMCINECCNLNIHDRKKNCPMANELYDLCVQANLATIVFYCPIWDTPQELA